MNENLSLIALGAKVPSLKMSNFQTRDLVQFSQSLPISILTHHIRISNFGIKKNKLDQRYNFIQVSNSTCKFFTRLSMSHENLKAKRGLQHSYTVLIARGSVA